MSEDEIRKANKEIAELKSKAMKAIEKAQAIADEHGIEFTFDLAYGMGGTYIPAGAEDPDWMCSGDELEEGRWMSSSEMC